MIYIKLYEHQKNILKKTNKFENVAYFLDMGLGKTYVGSEKMHKLNNKNNLVICQKSKVSDWVEHFYNNYDFNVYDLTKKANFKWFLLDTSKKVGILNYDIVHRRQEEIKQLKDFTLMLDESSMIANLRAKRTKTILKLKYKNVILLSGTPASNGKYEKLYSQLKLLGYKNTLDDYINMYCKYYIDKRQGFPLKIITGYKNIDGLKKIMEQYGCVFMKTEEAISLPDKVDIDINVKANKYYREFKNNSIVEIGEKKLIGDCILNKLLYLRQLCGLYSEEKKKALIDLLTSTNKRVIIFYNFKKEYEEIKSICEKLERSISVISGETKDIDAYNKINDSITLIQYVAGAMGLNLQKADTIIYFSPCLSSDLYEQSKKRINRIGQKNTCFYYHLIVKNSIEEKIYKTLAQKMDYSEKLFEKEI